MAAEDAQEFEPEYNIPPTTIQPVIRQSRESGTRELVAMRWGLVGFGSAGPDPRRPTFNARVENLMRSPLWRRPLHKHRCLIPVSGFYEWRQSDRKPFRFTLPGTGMYALAGLWDAWQRPDGTWLQSSSIITVPANATMSPYHERMPAILDPHQYDLWLDRGEVERPPAHLLTPYAGTMAVHEAHATVGNVRNQSITLLDSA